MKGCCSINVSSAQETGVREMLVQLLESSHYLVERTFELSFGVKICRALM